MCPLLSGALKCLMSVWVQLRRLFQSWDKPWSISVADVQQWTHRMFHLLENLEFGARNDATLELIRFHLKIGNRRWTSLSLLVLLANSSTIRDSLYLWQKQAEAMESAVNFQAIKEWQFHQVATRGTAAEKLLCSLNNSSFMEVLYL